MADETAPPAITPEGPRPRDEAQIEAIEREKSGQAMTAPAPPAPVCEILTRDEYLSVLWDAEREATFERSGQNHDRLLTHDAALRARAEKAEAERGEQARRAATLDSLLIAENAKKKHAEAERDATFLRGASWAYETLTGALIVPASFEEQARAALKEGK